MKNVMIYKTDKAFREVIQERMGTVYSDIAWVLLRDEILYKTGIHLALDNDDIDDAVYYIKSIRKLNEY